MKIAVIGAGAWGTALAMALARKGGHSVRLWAYEKEVVDGINQAAAHKIGPDAVHNGSRKRPVLGGGQPGGQVLTAVFG